MDKIREQIDKLRDEDKTCGVHIGECGDTCNYQYIQDCAADTMERLLAVYEAAEEFRKVWQHHCDRQGELAKSLEDARVCYELSEAIVAVKSNE